MVLVGFERPLQDKCRKCWLRLCNTLKCTHFPQTNADYREAGVETLAALAAPALMSYALTASLVMEVVDGAYSLANPATDEAEVPRFSQRKAA